MKPPFPPLSSAERERLFGKFSYKVLPGGSISILGKWESENIVSIQIPQLVGMPFYTPGNKLKCSGRIRVHKLAAETFKTFFQRIEDAGLLHLVKTFDGSYVPRLVRGSTRSLSNHSWGTAIDINCYANGLGITPPATGRPGSVRELVPIAHSCGLYWGGHFSRPDGMHFEVARV